MDMIQATKLRTNHLRTPMGISVAHLRLSWIPVGAEKQTAYQLRVSAEGLYYDTGKKASSDTFHILSSSVPSKTRFRWEILLWDEEDRQGEWETGWFETGLAREDWKAEWINPEGKIDPKHRQPASYLRKSFEVPKRIPGGLDGRARLYITAHGIYDAYLNGKHVDGYLLAPGNSQYNKRMQVQAYDVSAYLREGENEILITLGDGWYRGSTHNGMERNSFGTDVALLAQLEMGNRILVKTDASWEASQSGALRYNDLMKGEEYDARRETITDWHKAEVVSYGYGNLIGTDTVPVTAHEIRSASVLTTPSGETVLDFGTNMAGYIEFCLEAKAGQKLILTHGESLDENGNFTIGNFQNPQKPECFQRITYICREGQNFYYPTKCYMGFRYVKVEGNVAITGDEFTAVAIYSDMEQTGFFTCGNGQVNKLVENALRSMKSNFVEVPTDCPTREKSGYSGDLVTFCHTAMYLMDCYPVLAKWIAEQAATQFEDGCVRQIAPYNGKRWMMDGGAGWCDSFELIPWRMIKRYQDLSVAEAHYDAISRWMEFCLKRARKSRLGNLLHPMPKILREHFVDKGIHWGEWLEPGCNTVKDLTRIIFHGEPEVATAFLSYGCFAMSEIADALGKKEDSAYYKREGRMAREAYRSRYMKNGQVIPSPRQCRYVRPLAMGLLKKEEKRAAAASLKALIRENNGHLNTGFLSTHELCRVLTDNGEVRTAYDLLLQDSCPGWLYPVIQGATAIPERWDGIREGRRPENSLNHYSYGSIVGWLFDRVCGIVVEDGEIRLCPYPDRRLGNASAVYHSPLGEIKSFWEYQGDSILFQFTVPCNASAEAVLPDGSVHRLKAGDWEFTYTDKK